MKSAAMKAFAEAFKIKSRLIFYRNDIFPIAAAAIRSAPVKSGRLDLPVGCINNLIANWKAGGRAAENTMRALTKSNLGRAFSAQALAASFNQARKSKTLSRASN